MIKVISSGVFDVLNLGHINILTQAKKLGDYLIVGIQDDVSVEKYKGSRPVLDINERKAQIDALPFVDETFVYSDIDQRSIWDQYKPNVLVQGDDYIHSGDRTEALEYIKEKGIRLCLLPRTGGISSTEIKKRILRSNRKDIDHLKNIKILEIDQLSKFEHYVNEKVEFLVDKISREKVFTNPILVGHEHGLDIVADGVNRLEALIRLGCRYVPALVLPYRDIDLTNNVHYVKDGKSIRLSEFSDITGDIIEFEKRTHDDILYMIKNNEMIPNGETWHKPPYHVINLNTPIDKLKSGIDMEHYINDRIQKNNIRFYPSSVYTCNEWE